MYPSTKESILCLFTPHHCENMKRELEDKMYSVILWIYLFILLAQIQ